MITIIFLHAVVAHKHYIEVSHQEHDIAHKQADGLIAYFSLALHDGSVNDLENYLITKENLLQEIQVADFKFFGISTSNISTFLTVSETWYFNKKSKYQRNSISILPFGLRAHLSLVPIALAARQTKDS